jgi:hypothetical protein
MLVASLPNMCYVLLGVVCKAGLTTSVVGPTHTLIYFKEYRDDKQYLTYPSERLVECVSASVTVLEGMMAEVAHIKKNRTFTVDSV